MIIGSRQPGKGASPAGALEFNRLDQTGSISGAWWKLACGSPP